jgi:hypothetical protein
MVMIERRRLVMALSWAVDEDVDNGEAERALPKSVASLAIR